MNDVERYLFDLQGYLIIEDALTSSEVATLNAVVDEKISRVDEPGQVHFRFDRLLGWGEPFQALINNPRLEPYLVQLVGSKYRLDHDYIHIIRKGSGPIGAFLHGGGTPFDPGQYYLFKDGQMYNGLTAVAYNLTDVFPGEGGFGCVPGSHKCNFPLPDEWVDLEDPRHPHVQAIAVKAGSAIIFTEALSHGTLPWTGERDRRTLFFKYSPHPSAWSRHYPIADQYPNLSDAQRQLLRNPGISPP